MVIFDDKIYTHTLDLADIWLLNISTSTTLTNPTDSYIKKLTFDNLDLNTENIFLR